MSNRIFLLSVFGILFFAYAYINQGHGWNQNARLDTLHVLVEEKTFSIDSYHANTGDKVMFNGRYYSEKAPGIVAIALPVFAVSKALLHMFAVDSKIGRGWTVLAWITTAGSAGLVTALGGMALCALLSILVGRKTALITILALFLGAGPFPYATALFSHAVTAGLFAVVLFLLVTNGGGKFTDSIAGGVCGLAVASEYPTAIIAVGIFLFLGTISRQRARNFILGSLPFLALVPMQNFITSGDPFLIAHGNNIGFPGMKEGFFGFLLPNISVTKILLFSQYRGLLFWTPFLWLAVPGFFFLFHEQRRLFWLTLLCPVLYVVFYSGFYYWNAGWSLGPRYLVPTVPLLAIPAAYGCRYLKRTGMVLMILSVLMTGGATVVTATPPEVIMAPLLDFYLPRLEQGMLAMNIGHQLGLTGLWSIVPLVVVIFLSAAYLFWKLREDVSTAKPREVH